MQSEQVMFEGERCPVQQRIITPRTEDIISQAYARYCQRRAELNRLLDQRAAESKFMDEYEQGLRQ